VFTFPKTSPILRFQEGPQGLIPVIAKYPKRLVRTERRAVVITLVTFEKSAWSHATLAFVLWGAGVIPKVRWHPSTVLGSRFGLGWPSRIEKKLHRPFLSHHKEPNLKSVNTV
jgi:hypothetical protein